VAELENFFPIVFGHFAVAEAMSIIYSPYAEQSIASIVYVVLFLIMFVTNLKRKIIATRIVWGLMIALLLFVMSTAILELGQANHNKVTNECFSVTYESLY
jgi:uncharacterized membrane protein